MKVALLLATLLPTLTSAQPPKPRPAAWGYIAGQLTYPVPDLPAKQRILCVTAMPIDGHSRSYSITSTNSTSYRLRLPAGEYYVYAVSPGVPNCTAYYTNYKPGRRRYFGCPSGDARARMSARNRGIVSGSGWSGRWAHTKLVVTVEAGATTAHVNPQDWFRPVRYVMPDTVVVPDTLSR